MEEKSRLWPLYLTQTFRQFAINPLSLFSAIYIYKRTGLLKAVFFFYFLFYVSKFLINLLVEDWSRAWGLKKQVFFGQIFLSLAVGLLYFSEKHLALLFLGSCFWGVASGFYWFGWHGLLTKIGRLGHYGQALGGQELFDLVPLLASPILAGVLISFFGYPALFSASLFFVIFSLLALWFLPERRTHIDTTTKEILSLFKSHQRVFLAYFGNAASTILYSAVVPLYLFLIIKKEASIGGFFSLSLILVAILNFFIGRTVDLKGKRELIGFGAFFYFLIWLARLIAKTVRFLFFLDVFDRIVQKMTAIPLSVLTYEKALDGGATGRALLFREMAICLGALFAFCLLLIWSNLYFAFILGAIFSLFQLLIVKKGGVYGDEIRNS